LINIDFLRKIPFFSYLDDSVLEQLLKISTLKRYACSDILFYEKDSKDEIFYLVEGAIKFYKVDRFDNEIFLYKLHSNSLVFNITKMCQEHTIACYANAELLEDSRVLVFNSVKFRELMQENQDFMKAVLRESFSMIQQLQCIINRDVVFDGTAKVAHMLANDLKNFNSLKKHEIAYMLHIQPETLSRILKKLTRNDIIGVEKNSVKILNSDELMQIYE